MKYRLFIALVALSLLAEAAPGQSEEQAKAVYVYMYGLPSNRVTEGIRLVFFSDGILKSAEVRSIDQLPIEEAQAADFDSFPLASEAHVTRTEESICIEVNRIERGELIVRSFVQRDDGTVEILLPDRPNDRAWMEINGKQSTYFFNDQEVSSLTMARSEFIRTTRRLRYEYGRELRTGEIGRVHWDGIDEVTAILHDSERGQIDFEYFEAVPFWYRMVYTALPPEMSFRTAVLSEFLIRYAVANALYQQLFPLIAPSVVQ